MVAVLLAVRWLLGVSLAFAGAAKFADDLTNRVEAVANYQLVPEPAVRVVARGLPWLEIGLSVLLLSGVALRFAAFGTAALMLGFVGAMAWNLAQGRRFGCGCAGSEGRSISWLLVGYDTVLAIVALLVGRASSAGLAGWPGPGIANSSERVEGLLPVPMLVLLGAVVLRFLLRRSDLISFGTRPGRRMGA